MIVDLKKVLSLHRAWLYGEAGGKRADLTGANLTDAVLTRANLTGANLTGANLTRAVLTGAVLTRADLTRADLTGAVRTRASLTGANLTGADLTGANLTRAVLTGAVLTDADLTGAVLTDADLTGANLTDANIPIVEDIDAKILGSKLDMGSWHCDDTRCGTTHCRAGWAIHLAGEAGYELERKFGPGPAGALIYAKSRPGKPVPNFYCNDEDAMEDLRRCCGVSEGAAS
jgi:Pentapeptide repeats (8 copies)